MDALTAGKRALYFFFFNGIVYLFFSPLARPIQTISVRTLRNRFDVVRWTQLTTQPLKTFKIIWMFLFSSSKKTHFLFVLLSNLYTTAICCEYKNTVNDSAFIYWTCIYVNWDRLAREEHLSKFVTIPFDSWPYCTPLVAPLSHDRGLYGHRFHDNS